MSDLTMADVEELIGILRAQQQADAVVIKCLIASVVLGAPLAEVWDQETPSVVVDEQLYAQAHPDAKDSLPDFNTRLSYWNGIIRSAVAR